ncbi:MAG TPA: molybdenum cofactor biosynthesis protein MoaE [Thermoplasmata archaeon]|nr:molybdenum cofactor biosynthesis protein MoaE [Thermoplasmata archaeon]
MGFLLTRRKLSMARALEELEDVRSGGVALFLGRVRPDASRAGRVVALRYEAHESMAVPALERLARTARRRFGVRKVVLHHRLGRLKVGVVSVIVGAAAPHRPAAFRAARYLIERLKLEVPIWKTDRARPSRRRRSRHGPRAGRSSG